MGFLFVVLVANLVPIEVGILNGFGIYKINPLRDKDLSIEF
jgi:hypothetical protein